MFGVTSKMDTCEPVAISEAVVEHELNNPIFSKKEVIHDVIRVLTEKKILEDKEGYLDDRELEFFLKFGDIQSKDKRVLMFVKKELNDKLKEMRLELYTELYYPK
jgi:hypothetical protein